MACRAVFSLLSACGLPQFVLTDKVTVEEGIVANEKSRDAESEVQLFQPFSQLNRVTFGQNVLEPSNNGVDRWVVLFCLGWYEPCEAIERPFAAAGSEWQDSLNTNLLSTDVRFATVDCATDRVLCNEQMIHEYPQIVVYHKHAAIAAWSGGGKYEKLAGGMRKWLSRQLGTPRAGLGEAQVDDEEAPQIASPDAVSLDLLVVVLAMLGNAWVVTRNPGLNPAKMALSRPDEHTGLEL